MEPAIAQRDSSQAVFTMRNSRAVSESWPNIVGHRTETAQLDLSFPTSISLDGFSTVAFFSSVRRFSSSDLYVSSSFSIRCLAMPQYSSLASMRTAFRP
jgi:hypothetical protein